MSKNKKGNFHQYLKTMTNYRLMNSIILDSDSKNKGTRLLQDPETGLYLVFNGKYNQTYYTKSYQAAERYFLKCLEDTE